MGFGVSEESWETPRQSRLAIQAMCLMPFWIRYLLLPVHGCTELQATQAEIISAISPLFDPVGANATLIRFKQTHSNLRLKLEPLVERWCRALQLRNVALNITFQPSDVVD
jgi:hypothetical protein